jgi:hypothetical protein
MDYKSIILSQENLKKYCKQFKYPITLRGKTINLLCPFCNDKSMTAMAVGQTHLIACVSPDCPHKKDKFTFVSIVRKAEKDKKDWSKDKIIQYIKDLYQVKTLTPNDVKEQHKWFDYYVKNGFSLTPIIPNDKACIEKEWQNKEHKDPSEWKEWVKNNLNLGLNCGLSKVTVIDIDQKPIPKEIKDLIGDTLIAETTRGFHLIYKQDLDLPKTSIGEFILVDEDNKEHFIKNPNFPIKLNNRNSTLRKMNIDEQTMIKVDNEDKLVILKQYLKIDIENSNNEQGAQVVIYPSITDNCQRKFINENEIISIPEKFKSYLIKKIGKITPNKSTIINQETQNDTYKLPLLEQGEGRHDFLFRYACILRKQMSVAEVESAIISLNKIACNPPLEYKEIKNIINSTSQYAFADDKELSNKILEYLREVDEATPKDIERAMAGDNRLKAEEKSKIDKAVAYLKKEDLVRKKHNKIIPIRKVEWETSLIDIVKNINFKVPYFYDVANFKFGNLILISAQQKIGKTHVSVNILKQLIDQGITPYYLSLEPDNLFAEIALKLGLKEGDFKWKFCSDPTAIELEKNAITIIDWLMIENKCDTDIVFRRLIEQLQKTRGFLIVFQQLKEDNSYFAKNMVKQFPSLSARYIYDNPNDGTYGKFYVDVIRRPIRKMKNCLIPCTYNFETSQLIRNDELKENIKDEQIIKDEQEET